MKELKGMKGFSAWQVYNKVIVNLMNIRKFTFDKKPFLDKLSKIVTETDSIKIKEMLPGLVKFGKRVHRSPEFCILEFKKCDTENRSLMIIECLTLSNLDDDEVFRLLAVHSDINGIQYSLSNIENLDVGEVYNLMLETLIKCSYMNCDLSLLSDCEQDKIYKSRISIKDQASDIFEKNTSIDTADLISIAIKKNIRD